MKHLGDGSSHHNSNCPYKLHINYLHRFIRAFTTMADLGSGWGLKTITAAPSTIGSALIAIFVIVSELHWSSFSTLRFILFKRLFPLIAVASHRKETRQQLQQPAVYWPDNKTQIQKKEQKQTTKQCIISNNKVTVSECAEVYSKIRSKITIFTMLKSITEEDILQLHKSTHPWTNASGSQQHPHTVCSDKYCNNSTSRVTSVPKNKDVNRKM